MCSRARAIEWHTGDSKAVFMCHLPPLLYCLSSTMAPISFITLLRRRSSSLPVTDVWRPEINTGAHPYVQQGGAAVLLGCRVQTSPNQSKPGCVFLIAVSQSKLVTNLFFSSLITCFSCKVKSGLLSNTFLLLFTKPSHTKPFDAEGYLYLLIYITILRILSPILCILGDSQ